MALTIGVYTIALDEAKFADRWAKSCADADYRFVADTGSIDNTVELLHQNDVAVAAISVKPWRFDDARNTALALLPDDLDVVISLDMDEVLTPGWRTILEKAWTGNRLRYGHVWSWTASGKPDLTFQGDHIAGRHTHRWKHAVHEVLMPTIPEVFCACSETLTEHHPDPTKSRSQYLGLLKLAVKEDPHDDRNAHYLGREFYFNRLYREAIAEFARHLALPSAVWLPERAASMRYTGKCYQALNDVKMANRWFMQATLEDDSSREPLIDAATFQLAQNAFHATLDLCQRALETTTTTSYMAERYANNEGPYDLAAIAHFHLGNQTEAIALATKALEFNPTDVRLLANLRMMQP